MHRLLSLVLLAVVLIGCADVKIKRVSPNDYDTEGFRYYLPRPYVAVKKEFPVAGGEYLVSGIVDKDDLSVIYIDPKSVPQELRDLGIMSLTDDKSAYMLPTRSVIQIKPASANTAKDETEDTPTKPGPGTEGDPEVEDETTPPKKEEPKKEEEEKPEDKKPEDKEEDKPTVTADLLIKGDPNTQPLMPINTAFDIVMLPDFDQQYAVRVKPGIGKASAQVAFENGWMMERAAIDVDNTQLGRDILDTTQKFVDLALGLIAPGSLQLKAGAEGVAEGATSAIAKAAEADGPAGIANTGKKPVQVVLKISFIMHASPGLYPVLKPSENVANSLDPGDGQFIFKPKRPYTAIAFNVREEVQVELVSAAGIKGGDRDTDIPQGDGPTLESATRKDGKIILTFKEELASNQLPKINKAIGFVYPGETLAPLQTDHELHKELLKSMLDNGGIVDGNQLHLTDTPLAGKSMKLIRFKGKSIEIDDEVTPEEPVAPVETLTPAE